MYDARFRIRSSPDRGDGKAAKSARTSKDLNLDTTSDYDVITHPSVIPACCRDLLAGPHIVAHINVPLLFEIK